MKKSEFRKEYAELLRKHNINLTSVGEINDFIKDTFKAEIDAHLHV